ncbi:MAG: TonB-dependent receptor plug domain-containing protein [Bacteroidales bacterium]|jgi:iron complex outermembrane receptor protein|nr:TonB-dependent receptor plug domain-containing protein [Bacteroidales bacterium]HHV39824.1 TonB-dependent receptor plug domain-containing protein [Bacteroidales bacterium]
MSTRLLFLLLFLSVPLLAKAEVVATPDTVQATKVQFAASNTVQVTKVQFATPDTVQVTKVQFAAPDAGQDTVQVRELQTVTVTAQALLRDQGMQKTVLDSAVLRRDVTGSLAQVLGQSSTLFIKSYGRATLSTASFRGTSPSHTQVTWNSIPMNSPMLGMVDFSTIPAFFIDKAQVYHGPGATSIGSGSLGGAIALGTGGDLPVGTSPASFARTGQTGEHAEQTGEEAGQTSEHAGQTGEDTGRRVRPSLQYVQGVGSFLTFDEYLRVRFQTAKWSTSTRLYAANSKNEYTYTNYRKKTFLYDDVGNITGFEYPIEKNKNGGFRDIHILQEFQTTGRHGGLWEAAAWYVHSDRGIPFLNVDYKDSERIKNNQNDHTLRTVLQWSKQQSNSSYRMTAGYTYSDILYQYMRMLGDESWANMVHAQSNTHSLYLRANGEYHTGKWMFSGNMALNQHIVRSVDNAIVSVAGDTTILGYEQARAEGSLFLSARYRPITRLGLSATLRQDVYGKQATPPIPSLFAEYLLSPAGNVVLKASTTRNYRYPTLNDLYFMPGGNPQLKPEEGLSFDAGLSGAYSGTRLYLRGQAGGFYSRINNWIAWLPTHKGFWSPVNVLHVTSYGAEAAGTAHLRLNGGWSIQAEGNAAWTRSLSFEQPTGAVQPVGTQLPYVPEFSAAVTGRVVWKNWTFTYDWTYYSERTTTRGAQSYSRLGVLAPYFMNDVALEVHLPFPRFRLHVKGTVRNLFNEYYETVLARPMPGINGTVSIGIVPLFY